MHLKLPTLITEGRERDVVSYMYIPIQGELFRTRRKGVGVAREGLAVEVIDRVETYQNISRSRVELGDLQIHHVRPHLNPKPFQSNLN